MAPPSQLKQDALSDGSSAAARAELEATLSAAEAAAEASAAAAAAAAEEAEAQLGEFGKTVRLTMDESRERLLSSPFTSKSVNDIFQSIDDIITEAAASLIKNATSESTRQQTIQAQKLAETSVKMTNQAATFKAEMASLRVTFSEERASEVTELEDRESALKRDLDELTQAHDKVSKKFDRIVSQLTKSQLTLKITTMKADKLEGEVNALHKELKTKNESLANSLFTDLDLGKLLGENYDIKSSSPMDLFKYDLRHSLAWSSTSVLRLRAAR